MLTPSCQGCFSLPHLLFSVQYSILVCGSSVRLSIHIGCRLHGLRDVAQRAISSSSMHEVSRFGLQVCHNPGSDIKGSRSISVHKEGSRTA